MVLCFGAPVYYSYIYWIVSMNFILPVWLNATFAVIIITFIIVIIINFVIIITITSDIRWLTTIVLLTDGL